MRSNNNDGLKRKILNNGANLASKVASKIALPVAILSTIHDGGYFARGFGEVKTTYSVLSDFIGSYVSNSGIRDVVNGASYRNNESHRKFCRKRRR